MNEFSLTVTNPETIVQLLGQCSLIHAIMKEVQAGLEKVRSKAQVLESSIQVEVLKPKLKPRRKKGRLKGYVISVGDSKCLFTHTEVRRRY